MTLIRKHSPGLMVKLIAFSALSWGNRVALAQSAFGIDNEAPDASESAPGDAAEKNLDSDAAIQSATPTDDINELDQGSAGGGNFNSVPVNNFPKEEDIGSSGMSDPPVPSGGNSDANMFGGNGVPEQAVPVTTKAAPAPVMPAAAAPNNGSLLMNQINQGNQASMPAASAVAPSAGTPPLSPVVVPPPKPQQPMAPTAKVLKGPMTPVITTESETIPVAPTLPPPNEFSGAPTVPGTLQQVAEGEAPEDYKVQAGDTLYDICDQLLDEGRYWPKLWAMNPEIKNPHFIFPDMKLRFYPGDDENPPYLQVVSEDDVMPIDKGNLDEKDLIKEPIQLKISDEEIAISEGVPTEVIGPDQLNDADLQDGILVSGAKFSSAEVRVQVPGFIYKEEMDPLAFVLGGIGGEINMGPGSKAYVEASESLSSGTLYTVLRPAGKLNNPETGEFVGYKYSFVANLRVDAAAGDDLYSGTVQDTRIGMSKSDIVVNYISTYRTVINNEMVGALSSTSGNIIGFQFDGQLIAGTGNYAFIDKGIGSGITQGMFLEVFSPPGFVASTFGDSKLPISYRSTAVIQIIDATDSGSVGYVVKTKGELRVGDRVGKG